MVETLTKEMEAERVVALRRHILAKKNSSGAPYYTEEQRAWCTDDCLRRYLRARDWKTKKSAKLLEGTLKWRWEVKPHLITEEDVKVQSWASSAYVNGYDKEGHPNIYMKVSLDPPAPSDIKVKYLMYTMENVLRAMPEHVEKWAVIVDMKGFSLSQHGDIKVTAHFLKVLQSHYPERLARFVCVNTPKAFLSFWKIISVFVDDVTKQKFIVMGEDGVDALRTFFLQYYDEDQLEADFGGTLATKVPVDVHERLAAARMKGSSYTKTTTQYINTQLTEEANPEALAAQSSATSDPITA